MLLQTAILFILLTDKPHLEKRCVQTVLGVSRLQMQPGLEVIKLFSCSTQLSMKF